MKPFSIKTFLLKVLKYFFSPLLVIALLWVFYFLIYANFHKVDEKVYRSAQLFSFNMPYYMEKYKIKSIGIFGSYARGEQKETSDIDILIDYYEPISLLKLIELENYLSELIGIKVDVITKNSIQNPYLKKSIEEDLIYI